MIKEHKDIYGRSWPARRGWAFCKVCDQPLAESRKMSDDGTPLATRKCRHYMVPNERARELGAVVPVHIHNAEAYYRGLYQPERPFYVKAGGRYVCLGVLDHAHGSMTNGHYLMVIEDGCTSYRPVQPPYVEVEAAMHTAREAMTKALLDANRMKPDLAPLTPREIKAWDRYCKEVGDDSAMISFHGLSMNDLVEVGLDVIRERLQAPARRRRK